ncbi:hypothetical protein DV738_g3477, partial [Chaetothyriales sp. CBS 135597]
MASESTGKEAATVVEMAAQRDEYGGYGWVCVASTFFINGHTWGINSTYGVFLGHYLTHDVFPGTSPLDYAFIGGLSISMAMAIAPLATHVVHLYGSWACMHLGIFFETLALLGASFSKQKYQIILSQGVCFGWGMGLLFTSSVAIPPQWFTKKRSIATAISAAGSGCGAVIYSLAAQRAIDTVGLSWCLRILAICTLVANLIACNLVRDRNKETGARHTALDMGILKRREFILMQAWGWCSMFAYIIVIFSLPAYATSIGLSSSQGATLNAILNLGQMVGRPFIGLISDRYGRINTAMISCFGATLTVFCFWIPAEAAPNPYSLVLFYSIVGGALAGSYWCTVAGVVPEVVGLADMPAALSLTWLSITVPTTLSEPIALLLRHTHKDSWVYLPPQIFTALMFFGAGLSLLVLRGWKIAELDLASASQAEEQQTVPENATQVKSGADIHQGPTAVLPQNAVLVDRVTSVEEARRAAWKPRYLFPLLAIVQASLALDGQYSPFSDPLLARPDDELQLLLVRRQDACQTGYNSCDGSTGACCPDGSNCTRDAAGNVACCPTGALCTGIITATGTGLSLATTTTSGVILSSTTPTGLGSTITTDFSSALLPTSGVQGGGSTVANTFFPFVYIPTSYDNANLCLSAYSYCQYQSTACAQSLAGSGVTVSNAGGGGITIQGANSATLDPISASSICSSLSAAACYGLTSEQCGTPTTGTDGLTASTFFNHGPRQTACPGAIYAAAGAGAFVGGSAVPNTSTSTSSPVSPVGGPVGGPVDPHTIDKCVDIFLESLYPTYPIFKRQELLDKIQAIDSAEPEFYCLVAAICAVVFIQAAEQVPVPVPVHVEVLRVRKSVDYVENPTLMTIQISLFLFSAHFGLEKQDSCWFYLRESATIAQMMGLHEEATYESGNETENVYRRRTYWLIFITERAYALERHKPLSLYPSIAMPVTEGAEGETEVVNGLLYLSSLFRCIDDKFMCVWNKVDNGCCASECSTSWVSALQRRILDILPVEMNTTQYQTADIKVTQHWLRTVVWQLSIMSGKLSSSSTNPALTFIYPIEIARDLQSDLQKMSLACLEVHGIGLIEKLFDVACTLIDVIACVPLDSSALCVVTPQAVLDSYINLITQLHGGTSRYLPLLLAKISDNILSVASPVLHTTPAITQGYAGASDKLPTPDMPQDYGSGLSSRAASISNLANIGNGQTQSPYLSTTEAPATVDQSANFDCYSRDDSITGDNEARPAWSTPTAQGADTNDQSFKNGKWM